MTFCILSPQLLREHCLLCVCLCAGRTEAAEMGQLLAVHLGTLYTNIMKFLFCERPSSTFEVMHVCLVLAIIPVAKTLSLDCLQVP